MNRYWYHSISEKIDSFLDKAIFIKDTDNLFSNEGLLKYYKDLNIEIFNFSNDLVLRKKLLSSMKIIVLVTDERKLPYDLLNKFPILTISLKDILPTLDTSVFDTIDIKKLDLIYSDYIESDRKYIKKSYSETEVY